MNREEELDHLKTTINLSAYAAAQGYELNRRKTSRNSVYMEGPGQHKIVINRQEDGHWLYWSADGGHAGDEGSIIDFVQHRQGIRNIGKVRQILRPWAKLDAGPLARVPSDRYVKTLEPVSRDIEQVIRDYETMHPINGHHAYLEDERKIPTEILSDPRFADRIRTDNHHNAVFPHYNQQGLCGFELKNRHFNGFAKGGRKGLWPSLAAKDDRHLVIVEAAIDALSYHAIHQNPEKTRYLSIGGSPNPEQPELIRSAIRKLPPESTAIIATDHDEGGDELTKMIRQWIHEADRPDMAIIEDRPPRHGTDWNDVLRNGEPLSRTPGFLFPTAPAPAAR